MLVLKVSAVGDIQTPHADAATGRADRPRLKHVSKMRLIVGKGSGNIFEPDPGDDSNAIPLIDAEMGDLVAEFVQPVEGELFLLTLRFLDRQDVAVGAFEPGRNPVDSRADGVDVPGSNAHMPKLPGFTTRGFERPSDSSTAANRDMIAV